LFFQHAAVVGGDDKIIGIAHKIGLLRVDAPFAVEFDPTNLVDVVFQPIQHHVGELGRDDAALAQHQKIVGQGRGVLPNVQIPKKCLKICLVFQTIIIVEHTDEQALAKPARAQENRVAGPPRFQSLDELRAVLVELLVHADRIKIA
jgi:hypothetical protein